MQPNRRTVIAGIAGLTTGAIGVSQLGSDTALAQVEATNLTIQDTKHNTDDGEIQDLIATVDAEISIDASETPDTWELTLFGGPEMAEQTGIVRMQGGFTQKSQTITEEISGSLLKHDNLSVQDLTPPEGEEIAQDVLVSLELKIIDQDKIIAEDYADATATVTVTSPGEIELESSLGGSGELDVQT